MRNLGYVNILLKTLVFSMLPYNQQQKVQTKRLRKLVKHVKTHSPYFANLYKDIDEDFNLMDLPVTTKQMMMENFNYWLTDSSISLDQANEFMKDKGNVGHKVKNKYVIAETSGSTGSPATMLHDKTALRVGLAISFLRVFGFKFPIGCVFYDDSFGISNGTVPRNPPFIRRFVRVINSRLPLEQIVQELNAFKPRLLIGYPGTLELLTDAAFEGKLKIKPSLILVSGEHLSDLTRAKLSKAFSCTVHSIYVCTEGGNMAFECGYNHLHINRDWTILEPVDEEGRPVPAGEMADKVLLTNLANRIQPIIRYELTDRIIMHDEPCPCGKEGMWLEVEGRTSDVIYFQSGEKKIGVAPMDLYCIIEVTPGLKNFQMILHPNNEIELRLIFMKNADHQKTFEHIKQEVIKYLDGVGIFNVSIYLSDSLPQYHPDNGKFKQIYQADVVSN